MNLLQIAQISQIREQKMLKYVSTVTLCEIYDLSDDFFMRRKDTGEFEQNIHYIQQNRTIRWDLEAIENWWRKEGPINHQVEEILAKVI